MLNLLYCTGTFLERKLIFLPSFADQLTAARKAAGLTQEQLADAVHVARNTISSWERGRTQPDLDTLRLLGQVLHFDFMNGDAAPQAEPEIPAVTTPAKKRLAKRNVILAAIVIAVVVLIVCLLVIPKPSNRPAEYKDDSGKVYSVADYKAVTPNEAGKAYLSITTTLEKQPTSNGGHFKYFFKMKEENGIGFTIERMEHINFFYSVDSVSVDTFTADDIRVWGDDPEIQPYGVYELECGINALTPDGSPNAIGAAFQVWGTDASGNQLTFTAYIPLPLN